MVPLRDPLDLTIPNISWEKDYFTTCRTDSQKGPEISVPVGGVANITGIGPDGTTASGARNWNETGGTVRAEPGWFASDTAPAIGSTALSVMEDPANPGFPLIQADLSTAVGGTVNQFRESFALQRFAEARSKYGSRYTEYLRYLGSNYKGQLDRPVYLGGGQAKVQFSEVLQTGPEVRDETHEYGVGDMYGHGVAALRSNKYRRTFDEHGYVISMLSVRPKAVYTDGIDRHWLRTTNDDYYQKELELIGQQEVLNNEVFADVAAGNETFGYNDRYQEYRHTRSGVSAEFRNILNYWHMGREFLTPPILNQSFVDCIPTKRIYNEQAQHAMWIMAHNSVVARRIVGPSGQQSRII